MQFRRLVFPLVVVVITIVSVGISPAFAVVCPPGKVPTTIQNPAGKIIELCVPAEAVGHIGGNNDIVIPGRCPCFSQDDLDPMFGVGKFRCSVNPGRSMTTGSTCTYVRCFSPDFSHNIDLFAMEGPADTRADACRFSGYPTDWPPWDLVYIENNFCAAFIDPTEIGPITLNEADADACVTILNSFVVKQ